MPKFGPVPREHDHRTQASPSGAALALTGRFFRLHQPRAGRNHARSQTCRRTGSGPFGAAEMPVAAAMPDATKKAREVSPTRPIRKPSLKAKDYLLEAAAAAESAAEPAAVAAEAAESAAVEATEAAESADETAESVEAASPPLQADRVRAAPATAAARMILRMNGIP